MIANISEFDIAVPYSYCCVPVFVFVCIGGRVCLCLLEILKTFGVFMKTCYHNSSWGHVSPHALPFSNGLIIIMFGFAFSQISHTIAHV